MRIVLLGSGGQLAYDLARQFSAPSLICWTRNDVDLTDAAKLSEMLKSAKPDAVINSAAYNLVDRAEEEPDVAFQVNALAPRSLARICAELGCKLMHFSTDYVFGQDARRTDPWQESDAPGPVSVYGASKLAGEGFVQSECPRHFVVRTCGLFGAKGSRGKGGNFVETMLRLADLGKPVRVVNDQYCTPTYTADLACSAAELLATEAFGLYHATNQGHATWFEFASEIFRRAGKQVECTPITSSEFNAPAKRPAFSVLANEKLRQAGVRPLPPWSDALGRYLADRKA